jgi:hypothetical protein
MAKEFGWSEQAVRTFVRSLEKWGMARFETPQEALNVSTDKSLPSITTIIGYDDYQADGDDARCVRVPMSIFNHGMVGIRWRNYEPGEASLWLIMAEQDWSDNGNKPPYPHGVFGWHILQVKDLIIDLVERCLIAEDFAALLLGRLKSRNNARRKPLPSATRQSVWAKTSGKCAYCAQPLTSQRGRPNSFHVDHVLSVAKGGSDDIANLIPSCATCNTRKSAKPFLTFIEKMEAPDA